jgi:hypothetical protein
MSMIAVATGSFACTFAAIDTSAIVTPGKVPTVAQTYVVEVIDGSAHPNTVKVCAILARSTTAIEL